LKLFFAMVPEELGGAGVSHTEMCGLIRDMAQYCPSTALAFSMHQHLVAAAVWNYRQDNPGENGLPARRWRLPAAVISVPWVSKRLLRDAYAGQFPPLPPRKQHRFTGRLTMGLGVDDESETGS
jgi:Acyl-CoA dehydrogenase, N-terminal domain